ncbi:hypothetical protein DFH09DRAFT_587015 [Mycena vulgaris]|nr:hypothetical protein DFH09DRAFT_587015 [Mycena vulgaris]
MAPFDSDNFTSLAYSPTTAPTLDYLTFNRNLKGDPCLRDGATAPNPHGKGFHEYRGHGKPRDDIGRVGDVFWDVLHPFVFYFRRASGWEAWNPDSTKSQLLAEHPCYLDRYLWIASREHGLGWLASQYLNKITVHVKLPHALDDNDRKMLIDFLGHKKGSQEVIMAPSGVGEQTSKRKRADNDESVEQGQPKLRRECPPESPATGQETEDTTHQSGSDRRPHSILNIPPAVRAVGALLNQANALFNEATTLIEHSIEDEVSIKSGAVKEVTELRMKNEQLTLNVKATEQTSESLRKQLDDAGLELIHLRALANTKEQEADASRKAFEQQVHELKGKLEEAQEGSDQLLSESRHLNDVMQDQLTKSNADLTEEKKKSDAFEAKAAQSARDLIEFRASVANLLEISVAGV